MRGRKHLATAVPAVAIATAVAAPAIGESDGIHDDEARALYCMRAQQEVAGTDLVSVNVLHATVETFVESDATPYLGEGEDLPLTTHQLITSVPHPLQDRAMESVLSCKLKGGEAIQRHYGQGEGELGRFCADAHADIVTRVYGALTPDEQGRLVYTQDDIVLDPDDPALGGGDWTSGQPQGGEFVVPQIASEPGDGTLHLRSKALITPTVGIDVPPFVPRNKQGTHYCHLIAPDHLRETVLGNLVAAAPPAEPEPTDTNGAPGSTDDTQVGPILAETGGGMVLALVPLALTMVMTSPRRRRSA